MDTRKLIAIKSQITSFATKLFMANEVDPETAAITMEAIAGIYYQLAHETVINSMVNEQQTSDLVKENDSGDTSETR